MARSTVPQHLETCAKPPLLEGEGDTDLAASDLVLAIPLRNPDMSGLTKLRKGLLTAR